MLISMSAKARRRAARDGSQEVTTETTHHITVVIKAGRNISFSRPGSLKDVHAASTRKTVEKPI